MLIIRKCKKVFKYGLSAKNQIFTIVLLKLDEKNPSKLEMSRYRYSFQLNLRDDRRR